MAEKGSYLKEITQSERQTYILELLSVNPQGFRLQDIVDRFAAWDIEVKPRTIQRDIDTLSVSFCIEEEQRGRDVYYRADKYSLENIDITMSDLLSIAFIQELLEQYRGLDVAGHGMDFMNRIMKKLPCTKKMQFLDFQSMIKDMDANRSKNLDVNPEVERAVRNAIDGKRRLQITYYSWNRDVKSTRVIHPYRFVMMDGYMSVEAYCEMRKEMRNFRLSRIESIATLDAGFTVQPEYVRVQPRFLHLHGGEPQQIVLQFDAEMGRYVEEYEAHMADRLEKLEDGGVMFYKQAAITDELWRYVLGFGSHVRVVAPVQLMQRVQEEVERMAGMSHETDEGV